MRFSVLLPTRNRLDLLQYAVETVLRQDYDDWELVISDNYSDEDIGGYVAALGDKRIVYTRTKSFVPVTDNWNNALAHSSGAYVIMLGDDDCLMQGYLRTIDRLINEYAAPEAIYTSAFHYAYPGVMPGFPDGYLRPYQDAVFLDGTDAPFWLERARAKALVQASMNFKMRFAYNMQFSVVSRTLIDALRPQGAFFQSPYPDFYATNAIFLNARRVLVYPRPAVTIGISPKSFGYFYFNKREQQGMQMLQNVPDAASAQRLRNVLLPGPNLNSSWLFAMETLRANYGAAYGLRVNYARYRRLQIIHGYKNYYLDQRLPREELLALRGQMQLWERLLYGSALRAVCGLLGRVPPAQRELLVRKAWAVVGQYRAKPDTAPSVTRRYNNILEVFEGVEPL